MAYMLIEPGLLRTELALEAVTAAPDGLGGYNESWTEIARLFARIEPVSVESRFGADQTLETVTHRITVRRSDAIRSGMRFRMDERLFGILTVYDPDESGRYLICETREEGR